jgi:lipoate-protein ligase A
LDALEQKFADPLWLYGKNPPFKYTVGGRFPWGGVEIHFDVKNNTIADAQVFSDAMDSDFILELPENLRGCAFTFQHVQDSLSAHYRESPYREYAADVARLIFDLG